METTIAVSVTFKVNVQGDTAEALIRAALDRAMEVADIGVANDMDTRLDKPSVSVEGATALVNRPALEAACHA